MNRFQLALWSWRKSMDIGVPFIPALRLCWKIMRTGKQGREMMDNGA